MKPCSDCIEVDGKPVCTMNCGPAIPIKNDPLGIEFARKVAGGHVKLTHELIKTATEKHNERVIPEDLRDMYVYASIPEPKNNWAEQCVKLIERIADQAKQIKDLREENSRLREGLNGKNL